MNQIEIGTKGIKQREQILTKYHSDGIYRDKAKSYTKFLQQYDKNLVAKWLWDKQRWSVWTRDRKGLAYLVYVVETPQGGYRQIGGKDLVALGTFDLARKKKGYSLLKEIDDINNKVEESQKRKLSDDIKAICFERWRSFAGNPVVPVGMSFH